MDQQHKFAGLLRHTLAHDFRDLLGWDRKKRQFYFLPSPGSVTRKFRYLGAKQKTQADVVSVYKKSKGEGPVDYVRHHSFVPRFERLADQWYLIVNPSYHFTSDGERGLNYPDALLSGKKRLDTNSTVRGQVIMWHRLLSGTELEDAGGLLRIDTGADRIIRVGEPPVIELPKAFRRTFGERRRRMPRSVRHRTNKAASTYERVQGKDFPGAGTGVWRPTSPS